MSIDLYSWEYRPPLLNAPLIRRVKKRSVPNFGDEIGPMVVRALLQERGIHYASPASAAQKLFSVGSVMHFVKPGDHVWGTGINAKRPMTLVDMTGVTVHAVRGPKTAESLKAQGISVPPIYGDPGMLIKHVPELKSAIAPRKTRRVSLIPNFNDLARYRSHPDLISPLQPPRDIVEKISQSELVIGSSLHAMVFADALGVPSRLISSSHEHPFKYEDYYLGSGRQPQRVAATPEEAIKFGGGDSLDFDEKPLIDALPYELFDGSSVLGEAAVQQNGELNDK